VFGTTKAADTFVADDAAGQALAGRVQDLWTSFAATGTPSAAGVSWPTYDDSARTTLVLDPALRTQADPYAATRETWRTVTFDGTDPGLDRLTPLQYSGTSFYTADVIVSVYGWPTVLGVVAALVGVIVLIGWLVRHELLHGGRDRVGLRLADGPRRRRGARRRDRADRVAGPTAGPAPSSTSHGGGRRCCLRSHATSWQGGPREGTGSRHDDEESA